MVMQQHPTQGGLKLPIELKGGDGGKIVSDRIHIPPHIFVLNYSFSLSKKC